MKGRHYVAIAEKVKTRRGKHKWTLCAIFRVSKLGLPDLGPEHGWLPAAILHRSPVIAGRPLRPKKTGERPPPPISGGRRERRRRAAPAGGAALREELQPRLNARDLGERDL